jgi:transposase
MMAGFVIKLLEACPTTQADCALTRLSWSTVNSIMVSAVERGMLRRTEEEIAYLGIDEKSSERGHTYASILTDIDRSRVLDLVPERKLEAAVGLRETLTPAQQLSVKAVAMDMWPAYRSASRQCMPQAEIVHDKFHVSKYLGGAVDAVRKQKHRKLSQAGTSPLTGSKWAWLRKYPDGRSAEAISFRALNQLNLKTSRAWCIKENVSQLLKLQLQGCCQTLLQGLVEQRDA